MTSCMDQNDYQPAFSVSFASSTKESTIHFLPKLAIYKPYFMLESKTATPLNNVHSTFVLIVSVVLKYDKYYLQKKIS